MNISGKWKIRTKVNDVTGKISYRTSITAKDMNGNTEFYTIFLSLVKDAKNKGINDGDYIIVKPENAWLNFYRKTNDDKDTQIVAVVQDFEYADNPEFKETPKSDDLPF